MTSSYWLSTYCFLLFVCVFVQDTPSVCLSGGSLNSKARHSSTPLWSRPPSYLLTANGTEWLVDFIMIEHTVTCFVSDLYMHWWHHRYKPLGSKMSRAVLFLIHTTWQRAIHFVYGQKVITEFFTTSIIPIYKNKTHIIMYIILI